MELGDLHIFRTVVQAGGVTRAAERLNRVQSNVTTRVRQLEADLGVELFVRDGKKLHLSSAGRLLLDYADRLLDLAQEAREAVHDAKPRGLLRLGSMESTASVRLPAPMNEYLSRYPEVSLELRIGTPRELAAAVREGELDAALVAEPIPDAPFEKIPLYDEELVIIATANHPPIRSPHDVNGRPVLAFEAGCPYRQYMEDWFASSGEMTDRVIETSSYHAILGCAVAGMGISMVPRIVLKTFPDVKLLSVHTLPPEFNIAPTVFIRRKGAVSPKLTALIEVLTDRTDLNAGLTARRKAGSIAMQSRAGRQQTISPLAKTRRSKSPKSGKPELRASVSKTDADPSVETRSPAGR
jgi:DNA-binding transcriptional LysR family regulator